MGDDPRPRLAPVPPVGGPGETTVFAADEQDVVPIDLARWQRFAADVLADRGVRGLAELTVIFVGEQEIAELNAEHLGGSGPTDVLSFPLDAVDPDLDADVDVPSRGPDRPPLDLDDMPLLLGDVVVCPAVAERNAPTHAGTLDDELALLIAHGILHVLGHDHAHPEERATMQALERSLLERHHWHGPAPDGFRLESPE